MGLLMAVSWITLLVARRRATLARTSAVLFVTGELALLALSLCIGDPFADMDVVVWLLANQCQAIVGFLGLLLSVLKWRRDQSRKDRLASEEAARAVARAARSLDRPAPGAPPSGGVTSTKKAPVCSLKRKEVVLKRNADLGVLVTLCEAADGDCDVAQCRYSQTYAMGSFLASSAFGGKLGGRDYTK